MSKPIDQPSGIPWALLSGIVVDKFPNEPANACRAHSVVVETIRLLGPDFSIADLVHAMFRSGNDIPVERITITRAQYEAAMKGEKQ